MWTLGQLINSRYRILTVGAEGEGETLCRATDERSGKECLLDFIPCKPGGESDGLLVSQSDIEKLRELNHPLIVVPESIEETAEGFVVINDSFDGLTLEELLQAEGPLPLHRACFIVRQAAIALEASHHSGLIHGDLKPSDILLIREDGQERVKVRGFGIFGLKQHTFVNVARLALNSEGPILGHPGYISPEQALGTHADALDGRSDVYSLGVIFYRALSGRLPFERGSSMELLLAHIFSPPPSLAQSCEIEIPEVINSLVLRCLAKRREDRPASATALIDQLGPWEAREPAAAQTTQVQEGQAESALAEAEAPSSAEPAFRLANAPVFPVESVESQTPPVFVADFGSTAHAGAVDFSAAVPPPAPANRPTLEAAPMLSAGSVETKTQFVADLETPQRTELQIKNASLTAPPGPVSAAAAAPSPLDIPLDTARAPAGGQKAPPRQQAVEGEPTLFSKTYGNPQKTRPPSGSGAKWIWAAVILLLLIGGACGWLTYTGRTYWFRPQFVKQRISSLISSASGNGELHLQEVNQDPDSASPAP
ncbi:MAG: serine/threonine protein kinase, partial [Terriglobia bacterium]